MLFKRPVKVDIITKQKRDWWPLFISLFAVLVSIGTFLYSLYDLNQNRKQERNDFYSLNSSLLNINMGGNTSIKEIYQNTYDTTHYDFEVEIKNLSNFNCEILSLTSSISASLDSLGFYNVSRGNNIEDYTLNDIYDNQHYTTLLPNETMTQRFLTSVPKNLIGIRNRRVSVFLIYRNALGGYYHSYADADLQYVYEEFRSPTLKAIPLVNYRRSFYTYKEQEFPKQH